MSSTWASVVPAGTVPKDYPRHFDGLSARPGASVSRRSPRSRLASRASGWILGSWSRRRPGPAHRGQRRLELGANSYEVLVPRSPMGACIHAPWPWPRGDQKMRERERQTATKPRYYIRGIEITAISGLGRFGGGGGLVSDFDHQNHVVHLGLGRASWQGAQGHCPHHFDGLSARLGAPVSSRSPRSRAHRGHRAGFFGVGRACRPGPASAASRSLQKIVGAIVGAASRTGHEHLRGSSPPRNPPEGGTAVAARPCAVV